MVIAILAHDEDITADHLLIRASQRAIPAARVSLDRLEHANLSLAYPKDDRTPALSLDGDRCSGIWCRSSSLVPLRQREEFGVSEFSRLQWALALQSVEGRGDSELRWMNAPSANGRAANKMLQLSVAQRIGLRTPATLLSNDADVVVDFVGQQRRSIMKALRSGSLTLPDGSRRVVFSTEVFPGVLRSSEGLTAFPAIYQNLVEGQDVRACVIGSKVFAFRCLLNLDQGETHRDWRSHCSPSWELIVLPEPLVLALTQLVSELDLIYAAIDLVEVDSGNYVFLEANPAGQWAFLDPEHREITDAMLDYLAQTGEEKEPCG